MKAAVVHAYAPVQRLTVTDFPTPHAGMGEVLLEVEASEANFPDILHIEGRYQAKIPVPFVPGLGAVGRILRVGDGVDAALVGKRVLALVNQGAHGEQLAARADWCFEIPDGIPWPEAAALGLAYQTAWFALVVRGRFAEGQNVLVLGASGGVGMAAIQLAKALGAGRVFSLSRTAEGAALAASFGADHALAFDDDEEIKSVIMTETGGLGVHVIIDPVGGAMGEAAFRAIGWDGHYVVVGFAVGTPPQIKANHLLVKNASVCGLQWTDYRARQPQIVAAAQQRIFELYLQGRLLPQVSQLLPLERISEAYARIQKGEAKGKIVLTPRAATDN